MARFDRDALYDYRSHRPVLDIIEGAPKAFAMPTMEFRHRRWADRDLFVLTGPEPDFRWEEFGRDVLDLMHRFGVTEYVSLGAIPAAVPHTAPVPVMMTASSEELRRGSDPTPGLLRVPAAAVSYIEWTVAQAGIPAVGFWAQVPHYASPYAPGAIALIRRVETHLDVLIGTGSLEEQARSQLQSLEEVIAANPEAQTYVDRLQSMVGAEEELPGAENIAAEVERFLRQNQRGDSGPNPFSP